MDSANIEKEHGYVISGKRPTWKYKSRALLAVLSGEPSITVNKTAMNKV